VYGFTEEELEMRLESGEILPMFTSFEQEENSEETFIEPDISDLDLF
jgi:hypothetical protein